MNVKVVKKLKQKDLLSAALWVGEQNNFKLIKHYRINTAKYCKV